MASDASQAIGPLRKQTEDAFKLTLLLSKTPNEKVAEKLADEIEGIVDTVNGMKGVLKELQKASK